MKEVTVIGGINIDIEGSPFEKLELEDSNPGKISISHGGVGRNITENVARLGGDVAMLSMIGDDDWGKGAKKVLDDLGVDTSMIAMSKDYRTSMYISFLNGEGDMAVALSDMEIVDKITPEMLEENLERINDSKVVCLDGNLTKELISKAGEVITAPMFFDPVSAAKAVKAKDLIGEFYAIKPNIMEAEVLSGLEISSEDDLVRAGNYFLEKGVKQVFITLNKRGVFYTDGNITGFIRPKENLIIKSATGAGDAFSSVILMGIAKGFAIDKTAKLAMAASQVAMEVPQAVNNKMSLEEIEKRV